MTEHYFSAHPSSADEEIHFAAQLAGQMYKFYSSSGVFSKDEVDLGSKILIDVLPSVLRPGQIVADLGCGYGAIGIAASGLVGSGGRVWLLDINERAVSLAKKNLQKNGVTNAEALVSDGFQAVAHLSFDWIVTNPPIRAGKRVLYPLIEQAAEHLRPGGGFLAVVRTKQGAASFARKMEEVFGGVETLTKERGFRVFLSKKEDI